MGSRSTSHTRGRGCPGSDDLATLLRPAGRDNRAAVSMLRHLLGACSDCWQRMVAIADDMETENLPFRDPLAVALHSAALGRDRLPRQRFLLMRPLHRQDAYGAHGSPKMFCRLLLHETLAAALRPPEGETVDVEEQLLLFDEAWTWIQDACLPLLRTAARNDLRALGHTYRAFVHLLFANAQRAQFHLQAADALLHQGEQGTEPRVTWWTFSANRQRWLAATSGPERDHRLWRAEYCLRRALRHLPVSGCEEQRAELLHDQALVSLQLGAVQRAGGMLARADALLSGLGPAAGPYLHAWVLIGRAQAEARLALARTTTEDRRQAVEQTWRFFRQAVDLGCLDHDELKEERRILARRLQPLDVRTSPSSRQETPQDDEVPS